VVTTEIIMLLVMFFFVAIAMVGKLNATFTDSAPRLGAKVEKYVETGSGFAEASESLPDPVSWIPPAGAPGRTLR
jgi:hypothetical protein